FLTIAPLTPLFLSNPTAPTSIYTLSLHDALPICTIDASMKSRSVFERIASFQPRSRVSWSAARTSGKAGQVGSERESASPSSGRSEEHTSELQSPCNLVCRLLLEKKKKKKNKSLA